MPVAELPLAVGVVSSGTYKLRKPSSVLYKTTSVATKKGSLVATEHAVVNTKTAAAITVLAKLTTQRNYISTNAVSPVTMTPSNSTLF